MKNKIAIENFWKWFQKNDAHIRESIEAESEKKNQELVNLLDHEILNFGHFTWEIAKGKLKQYAFIISPNRDFELLKLSKNIVNEAPEFMHWEFEYAKSKETFLDTFKVYDEKHDPHLINSNDWKYKLENGTFLVYAPNLIDIDKETESHVLDLVATAVLGEEFRIEKVHKITRIENSDSSFLEISSY